MIQTNKGRVFDRTEMTFETAHRQDRDDIRDCPRLPAAAPAHRKSTARPCVEVGSGDGPDEVGVPRRTADAQGLRRRRGLVRVHRDLLDGQQLPSNVVERLQETHFRKIETKSRNHCGSDGHYDSDGYIG